MAFIISLALFGYFWIVGFALLGLLYRRDDLVRTVLIAPAVGIVVTVYANYGLSRLGFPTGSSAAPLSATLLIGASVALLWQRPLLPGWRSLSYGLLLVAAFVASGWPLFDDGFAWLAGLNPDAANYMLDATRLFHQPFIANPDAETWLSQADWSSYYVTFPLTGVRTGSDLLLAWVVTVTGRDAPAIYMPLVVSLHVAALAAATALISQGHRFARLLSGALLATSALSSIGVTLQLLGQELGLTCLILACVLLLSPFYRLSLPALARFIILGGIAMAGFALSYPEMLPFLGIGFLIFHGTRAMELRRYWRRALGASVLLAGVMSLLAAPDLLILLKFLLGQASIATSVAGGHPELFPYFLLTSGIGALWGLHSYIPGGVTLLGDNLVIIIGVFLSGATLVGAMWMIRHREPCAVVLMVMVLLSIGLFWNDSGFGIFKLAMYAQPFLMTTAVLSLCRLLRVAR